MKFIHHYTGEWERSDCNTAATRSPGFVREYQNLNAIDDAWIKSQFQTALELGHEDFDYHIGSTRIVCNPRGYDGYEARAGFWQPKLIEL